MRTLLLVAALLPLGLAGIADADHVGIGYTITPWCSWLTQQEAGCSHTESTGFLHIHMFGVTPRAGLSLPTGSTVTVTISGITAFTNQPFAQTHTCDLGLNLFTPQPATSVGAVDSRLAMLGDLSIHQTCGSGPITFHHTFVGPITLTAEAGEGVHAFVDAWVSK